MKRIIAIFLLVVMMVPTFSKLGIMVNYQINKDYIAKVLCENRLRPQLHCDGKCYLAKQLKAQEAADRKAAGETAQRFPQFTLFFNQPLLFTLASFQYFYLQTNWHYFLDNLLNEPSHIFKPPWH